MKKVIVVAISAIITGISFAQENNPYNQRGGEYVASVNMIADDFSKGLVTDFSGEEIVNYSTRLPLKSEVSMDLVAAVIRTMKTPGFDGLNYIEHSTMPDISKEIFKHILYSSAKLNGEEFKSLLGDLANKVHVSAISEAEKEVTFSLIAIAHSSADFSPLLRQRASGCFISGPNGSGVEEGEPCVMLGTIVGAWIGFEICGPLCMLGGAIVGGIIGGLS